LRRISTAAAFLALLLLSNCAPGSDLEPIANYAPDHYHLGTGDRVRVITFGESQLTGEFPIDDQGGIAMPLLGNVKAAGLTTNALEQRIAAMLKEQKLIPDASVSVSVAEYRPIFVLGEVAKPGQYPYQPGMTMLTAVAVAGGFTYRGVEDYADDIRTVDGKVLEGKITPQSFIAPGDVIKIYLRRF